MALLKYIGTSHFRELLVEDLEKLGAVGHNALMFAKDEVTEVAQEVYTAIMGNLSNEFQHVEADAKEQAPNWFEHVETGE